MIDSKQGLEALCREVAAARRVALDTEFVSEHTYRPQLCLVQVAVGNELVAIDPLAVNNLAPLWEALAEAGHETIVHAGREEVIFSLAAIGRPPAGLFDVQIAAGLVGADYPAGYGTLISRILGEAPQKGETRTDWRRRPLSQQQVDYALEDVRHLAALREELGRRLEGLGRMPWLQAEMSDFLADLQVARSAERWRKVSGSSALGGRSRAIVRELWLWREREAERRDWPVRRVLRDDLIVELAKRRSADPKHIRALRGMERADLGRAAPALSEAIARGLAGPAVEEVRDARTESSPQLTMLTQLLSSALGSICRDAQVAVNMVGTASDVRELIAWQLGRHSGQQPPWLSHGWRAEVVGRLLDDLLTGKVAIRIRNPRSEQPLAFERLPADSTPSG